MIQGGGNSGAEMQPPGLGMPMSPGLPTRPESGQGNGAEATSTRGCPWMVLSPRTHQWDRPGGGGLALLVYLVAPFPFPSSLCLSSLLLALSVS